MLAGPAITNNAGMMGLGGVIESAAGTSIVVSQGLSSNAGLIALTGGAFDNNSHVLSNIGSILGNGTFSTGGLNNNGTVTFSDGNTSVFGAVTNSGGTINTYGTSATTISFYGAVTNSASQSITMPPTPAGRIKINGNTVRWLGGLTNNGIYISDPADNYFTGLAVGASGVLQGGVGDRFFVTGSFTNAGQINLGGTSAMVVGNGAGVLTQTAGQLDLGTSATLSAGTVEIDGGTLLADGLGASITASLIYDSSTASTYQGILAGAGKTLTLDNPNALLVLSGPTDSFTGGTFVTAGILEITNNGALPGNTTLTVGAGGTFIFDPSAAAAPANGSMLPESSVSTVPEPGTLTLLLTGLVLGVGTAWRKRSVRDTMAG